MNCNEIENLLDDYIDELIHPEEVAAIVLHLKGCSDCKTELQARHAVRQQLRALPVPQPTPEFFEKAVVRAAEVDREHSRRRTDQQRRQAAMPLVGSLAAALLVAILLGSVFLTGSGSTAPDHELPTITLDTDTVTPVKLAFSSEQALVGARLTIQLPIGVELVGYNGRSDISWTTDLEQGTNVLRLPLVGRSAATDLLIAKLEHPTGTKTFRLQVTVN
ncbi:MAG: anti-sigma factor [Pseudomonadales bacterium]